MRQTIKKNLANMVTTLGLISASLCLFVCISNPKELGWITILAVITAITDFVDGRLASRLNITSDFGRLIDQLRDRVFVYPSLIILIWEYRWRLSEVPDIIIYLAKAQIILIIAFEVFITIIWIIGAYYRFIKRFDINFKPNKFGKRKTFAGFAIVVVWILSLNLEQYANMRVIQFSIIAIDLGLTAMVYWIYKSFLDYCERFKERPGKIGKKTESQ